MARPVELKQPAVMDDAVDHGRRQLAVPEHGAPFRELYVGGQHQADSLVTPRHHLKQKAGAVYVERHIAELVQNDEAVALDAFACGKEAPANSILFSVRAPVGSINLCRELVALGRGLAGINHRDRCQSYLLYQLKSLFYKKDLVGNGSIYASISGADLKAYKLTIPSADVVRAFERVASSIAARIDKLDQQSTAAREARDRLLPCLMSGEIQV